MSVATVTNIRYARHLILLTHHQLSEDVKKDVIFAQLHRGHDMTPRIFLAPKGLNLGLAASYPKSTFIISSLLHHHLGLIHLISSTSNSSLGWLQLLYLHL